MNFLLGVCVTIDAEAFLVLLANATSTRTEQGEWIELGGWRVGRWG